MLVLGGKEAVETPVEVSASFEYPELAGTVGVDGVLWAGRWGGVRECEEEGDGRGREP